MQLSIDVQKLILEYVKTIAIIAGIVFALLGIYDTSREKHLTQLQNDQNMIAFAGSAEASAAATALQRATDKPPYRDADGIIALLTAIAPWKAHFVTWAACMKFELCDQPAGLPIFCSSVVPYEQAIANLYPRIERVYDRAQRNTDYFGLLDQCPPPTAT